MLFHSTRGKDSGKDFASILMQGLADDGGLFMPDYWPQVDLDEILVFEMHDRTKYVLLFYSILHFLFKKICTAF